MSVELAHTIALVLWMLAGVALLGTCLGGIVVLISLNRAQRQIETVRDNIRQATLQ